MNCAHCFVSADRVLSTCRRQLRRTLVGQSLGDDAGGAGVPEPQREQAQQSGEAARSPTDDAASTPQEAATQPAPDGDAAESAFTSQLRLRTL